ncbi:MarR family transcriptional regulator [Cecembia sp.]|uniref:MarR family winged helix-turn-helix transcriptional regulator n=1 Tax=Cecembia sp. TaxID=1898110 RepID=UPI0025C6520F|nr:MarR family transcriptional regulator [Cecembia sp.]
MAIADKEPGFPFYVVSRLISQAYREPLKTLGLTYPQYLVMLCLWEKDGLMVSQIGERLSLDSGTLTPLLKRLETMNLVKRERSEEDERKVQIELTYPGKSLQSKSVQLGQHALSILDGWKEKDKEKLFELVQKLIQDLNGE